MFGKTETQNIKKIRENSGIMFKKTETQNIKKDKRNQRYHVWKNRNTERKKR